MRIVTDRVLRGLEVVTIPELTRSIVAKHCGNLCVEHCQLLELTCDAGLVLDGGIGDPATMLKPVPPAASWKGKKRLCLDTR